MKLLYLLINGVLLAAALPGLSGAADLQQGTLKAWNEYIRGADLRMTNRVNGPRPFLWSDESPDRDARVRRGEVVIAPMVGRGTEDVPDGLIHDWIGAVFIPGTTTESLLTVVHDYDAYKRVYKPVVTDSRMLACTATDQEFSMTLKRRVLFVTAALEGRYRAHDVAVDSRRGYNIAGTTEVQEVEDYGHGGEHLLPPDSGSGYIWRLHSIARYEERDGGVYLELEAIALTRDIPVSLRWLVSPVVNHLSINSLTATLRQTRQAVIALPPQAEPLAVCTGRIRRQIAALPSGGQ